MRVALEMNLNKDNVIRLIREYEKQRVLWDCKNKWRFNKNRKHDAWDEIARRMNVNVEDARRKMSSLLGSFRREKAKGRKKLGTGNDAKEVYKSDWFAFKSFAFLVDKDEPRETPSSEEINDEIDEYNVTSLSSGKIDIKPNLDCSDTTPVTSCSTTKLSDNLTSTQDTSKKFVKLATPRKKRPEFRECEKGETRIKKTVDFLQQPIPKEDSTHTFGKYMAKKLNQFNATKKAILIHKINQLIYDVEMEELSAKTAVSHCGPALSSSSLSSSTPSISSAPGFFNCTN